MKKFFFLVLLVNLVLNIFGQNVGIGTTTPLQKLDVAGKVYIRDSLGIGTSTIGFPMSFPNTTGDKISLWGSSGNHFGLGIGPSLLQIHVNDPSSHIGFGYGNSASFTEWVRIAGNGNVGIGTNNPNAPLQFSNSVQNRKIVLYDGFNNDNQFYGLGINGFTLRYQVSSTNDNHVFYAGTSFSTSDELMRITGVGNVGLGISSPQNKMDINSGAARTGGHPTGLSLYVTGNSSSASNGAEFRHDNGSQGIGFGFNTIYATGSNADQDLGMAARGPAGNLIFSTNASEAMRITPDRALLFSNTTQNRKLVLYDAGNNNQFYGLGVNPNTLRYQVSTVSDDHVFYAGIDPGTSNELMRISGNGNVGIGNASSHAPLQFSNTFQNRKIVLSEIANNDHQFFGFGINSGVLGDMLRYQVSGTFGSHVFYSATSATSSKELMRINGDGHVRISGSVLIGYQIVESAEVSVNGLTTGSVTCTCPPDKAVLSGGYHINYTAANSVSENGPINSTAWRVTFYNGDVGVHTISVYAICARIGN